MNPNAIYPTHTCFDDAMEMIDALLTASESIDAPRFSLVRLVHAVCYSPEAGEFSHAWLELDGRAYSVGIYRGERVEISAELEDFYQRYGVRELTKYSIAEAMRLNETYRTFGPWEPRYLELCRNHRKAL